jgi:hypothetical protein
MGVGKIVRITGFDSLFAIEVGYAMLELLPFSVLSWLSRCCLVEK